MLLNPIKPVLQIGIDDFGGGTARIMVEPAVQLAVEQQARVATSQPRQGSISMGTRTNETLVAVPIHIDGNKAGFWLTAEDGMVVFRQLGECQVVIPDIDDRMHFKIPGYLITCENIRGHFAVVAIRVDDIPEGGDHYPRQINVIQGSVLAKYLIAERFTPLV